MAKTALLQANTLCPTVQAAIAPIMAEKFSHLTVVAVTLSQEGKRQHVEIALEHTGAGFHNQPLSPQSLAQLPKISLEECETASRALSDILDKLPELENQAYTLDVGSPGVFRRLTTLDECRFYTGWPVAAKYGKTTAEGHLAAVENEHVMIATAEGEQTFPVAELPKKFQLTLNPPLIMPKDSENPNPA